MGNFIKSKSSRYWLHRGPPFDKLRAGSLQKKQRWGILGWGCRAKVSRRPQHHHPTCRIFILASTRSFTNTGSRSPSR